MHSETDDIDACVDLILSLQSILGESTYPLALRAASLVSLESQLSTELFQFTQGIGRIRNNLFRGSSDPFSPIKKDYDKDEFIAGLRGLARHCFLRSIWISDEEQTEMKAMRDRIEQSVWDDTIRNDILSEIPGWVIEPFKPPKRFR